MSKKKDKKETMKWLNPYKLIKMEKSITDIPEDASIMKAYSLAITQAAENTKPDESVVYSYAA